MAVLIPDVPKDCTSTERLVYERLGRELPSEWVVLHSLGLHGHATKIWGEADIVVLTTKGFFALEVKGGRVECRDGIWHYGEPSARGYTKKEDPWTQSKDTMIAIRNQLHGSSEGDFRNILFGYGVVMPNEHFTATGPEIEPAVLLDKREFRSDLGRYISRLQRHWTETYREKHGREYQAPTKDQIRLARKLLRPDIESAFSIGGYLTGVESRLLQLTNEQIRASRRMAANPRTIVRGQAGTGKTVIAIERAKQLAEAGARVLYLCYNQLLANHIRRGLSEDNRARSIDVRHVHSLYHDVITSAGLLNRLEAERTDERDFYATVFPQIFVDAVLDTGIDCWDALVVDEAQDLLTPDNLDAFDVILRDGLRRGRWHMFLDPQQNIYGALVQEQVELRLSDAYPAFDDLWENCRNTKQVALQASIISGIDLAIQGAPEGQSCENIYYSSHKDCLEKLDALVARLIRKDVRPQDIVILSTRRWENSLIAGTTEIGGCPVIDARDEAAASRGSVLFSTMHSFKGLERLVVLAIDMEEIGQETRSMLHYAGLSRACGLLRTFLPDSARAAYGTQAAAFGDRMRAREG